MRFRRASAFDGSAGRQRKPGRGALMIEFGFVAALLALAAITAMTTLGVDVSRTFQNTSTNRAV
jgi:pilus assembly protein Flp/PilA